MTRKQSITLISLIIITCTFMVFLLLEGSPTVFQSNQDLAANNPDPSAALVEDVQGKRLDIQVAVSEDAFTLLQQWTEAYQREHPDLTIVLENRAAEGLYEHYKAEARLEELADVILMDNHWIPEYAALGYLQALDPLSSAESQNEIHNDMMNQIKWNGYTWGLPQSMNPYVLVLNREVLERHAYAELSHNLTEWAEMIQAFNPTDGAIGMYMNPDDINALLALLWTPNDPAQETDGDAAYEETSPVLDVLEQIWADMGSQVQQLNAESDDPWQMLVEGKLAFYLTDWANYYQHANDNLDVMNIPDLVQSAFLTGRSYVISSDSDLPQEAFEWITDMTSRDKQVDIMAASGWLPVDMSCYQAEPITLDRHFDLIANVVMQNRTLPLDRKFQQKLAESNALQTSLQSGEVTVAEFVQTFQTIWSHASLQGNL